MHNCNIFTNNASDTDTNESLGDQVQEHVGMSVNEWGLAQKIIDTHTCTRAAQG